MKGVSFWMLFFFLGADFRRGADGCYAPVEEKSLSKFCVPEFENAAFNATVASTNTCGSPTTRFCKRKNGVVSNDCGSCGPDSHPPGFAVDMQRNTWWQSETLLEGVQNSPVNLTVNLGGAFEVTYVNVKFVTMMPDSFSIEKRSCETCPWKPWQHYSSSCPSNTNMASKPEEALCSRTDSFSSDPAVAFSTLSGRHMFPFSSLRDWTTATSVRFSLKRIFTWGDEIIHPEPAILSSYYFAISGIEIGGRCKCNGHAQTCQRDEYSGLRFCSCEHHTTGPDCGECQPFYRDRPWGPATAEDAQECKICDCDGLADSCVFDEELYKRTGSGGRCVGCRNNTAGPHCRECKPGFVRRPGTDCMEEEFVISKK